MSVDLKSRRLELDMTLEQVGDFVGVSKTTVRRWETGDIQNMRRDRIARLAEILKIDPAELAGYSPTVQNKEPTAPGEEQSVSERRLRLIEKIKLMSEEDFLLAEDYVETRELAQKARQMQTNQN